MSNPVYNHVSDEKKSYGCEAESDLLITKSGKLPINQSYDKI